MPRLMRNLGLVMSLSLMLAAVGCEDKKQDMATVDQQGPSAADRIRALQDQLDMAERGRIQAENESQSLRNEIDSLRDQLADLQAKQQETPDGWTSYPGGAMISIEGTVLFDSGKAKLRGGADAVLNKVADAINSQYSGYDIYVFGHTDSQPIKVSKWQDNLDLSCARAANVIRFVRSKGISNDMVACGWGFQRPVGSNSSAQGRQANRRVEIYAVAPK